jgi:hypothetical protein
MSTPSRKRWGTTASLARSTGRGWDPAGRASVGDTLFLQGDRRRDVDIEIRVRPRRVADAQPLRPAKCVIARAGLGRFVLPGVGCEVGYRVPLGCTPQPCQSEQFNVQTSRRVGVDPLLLGDSSRADCRFDPPSVPAVLPAHTERRMANAVVITGQLEGAT